MEEAHIVFEGARARGKVKRIAAIPEPSQTPVQAATISPLSVSLARLPTTPSLFRQDLEPIVAASYRASTVGRPSSVYERASVGSAALQSEHSRRPSIPQSQEEVASRSSFPTLVTIREPSNPGGSSSSQTTQSPRATAVTKSSYSQWTPEGASTSSELPRTEQALTLQNASPLEVARQRSRLRSSIARPIERSHTLPEALHSEREAHSGSVVCKFRTLGDSQDFEQKHWTATGPGNLRQPSGSSASIQPGLKQTSSVNTDSPRGRVSQWREEASSTAITDLDPSDDEDEMTSSKFQSRKGKGKEKARQTPPPQGGAHHSSLADRQEGSSSITLRCPSHCQANHTPVKEIKSAVQSRALLDATEGPHENAVPVGFDSEDPDSPRNKYLARLQAGHAKRSPVMPTSPTRDRAHKKHEATSPAELAVSFASFGMSHAQVQYQGPTMKDDVRSPLKPGTRVPSALVRNPGVGRPSPSSYST